MTSALLGYALFSLIYLSSAQTATPTFSIVATSTLIPPYGTGPAIYYASSMGDDRMGTTYAITCIPRTTANDPCKTATFGTGPQVFFQGPFNWYIVRSEASTATSGFEYQTNCEVPTLYRSSGIFSAMPSPLPSCEALPTPQACKIGGLTRGGTSTVEMCSMGMKQQEVLMIQSLPISTPKTTSKATSSSNSVSFTDIGRTVPAAPIPTVTIFEQPRSLGTPEKKVGRCVVGLAMAAVVMLAVG